MVDMGHKMLAEHTVVNHTSVTSVKSTKSFFFPQSTQQPIMKGCNARRVWPSDQSRVLPWPGVHSPLYGTSE